MLLGKVFQYPTLNGMDPLYHTHEYHDYRV
jgi:hypothetical protein